MSDKPNCYKCIHRGEIPGTVHSRCSHPIIEKADPMDEVMAIFASVGRATPKVDLKAAVKLGIKGDEMGIRRGWFNWPYNFDPTWLRACTGFEAKRPKEG